MDLNEEDADLARAIRLSLAESQPRSPTTTVASSLPTQSLPLVIDLTDEFEPIKVEPSTETAALDPGPMMDTGNRGPMMDTFDQEPMIGTFDRGPTMGTFDGIKNNIDEEDEDLKLALALSLSEVSLPSSKRKKSALASSIFDGLGRAEMERQRQERIKRRAMPENTSAERLQSDDKAKKSQVAGLSSDMKTSAPERAIASPPLPLPPSHPASKSKARALSSSSASTAAASALSRSAAASSTLSNPTVSTPLSSSFAQSALAQSAQSAASSPASPGPFAPYLPEFPVATFRNTCIEGTAKGRWEIRFEDLVKKEYLMKAVFTTFKLEMPWLRTHLPSSITQCIAKHWSRSDGERAGFTENGTVMTVHPPLNGFGSFHPKLMILFYPAFCRVVVSSANLVSHDWLQLVNTVYVQDFPLLLPPKANPVDLGVFGHTLYDYLQAMDVPGKVLYVLKCVDFSSAKVLLIPSVQGLFPVFSGPTYGVAQLSKVLHPRVSQDEDMEIEYQTSSLGKLNLKFLGEFARASRGVPVRARYKVNVEERVPPIKVVFPTEMHVLNSRLGEPGAGTVCLQEKYWAEHSFPKRVMHDFECVGASRGSLMHSKIVLARGTQTSATNGRPITTNQTRCAGWIYVGSANFTDSAWGTISSRRATPATPEAGLYINIRNWELGVVYMIETEEEMQAMTEYAKASGTDRASDGCIQSFFGPLPVPYRRPLRAYAASDRPWSQGE